MILKSFLARLFQGHRTGTFPTKSGPKLPPDFRGRPVLSADMTEDDLKIAADACPSTGCLAMRNGKPSLDMGRCTFCGRCALATKRIQFSKEYRLAVFKREDLVVYAGEEAYEPPKRTDNLTRAFKRSFQIREVSAGGCGACEADFNVLGTLAWDLGRFGIKVVASPRHADAVYVTGPVSRNMALALEKTYDAMSEPNFVIAAGACAISGGLYAGSPDVFGGAGEVIKEPDLFIPGCPPHPATALEGLLRFIGRV